MINSSSVKTDFLLPVNLFSVVINKPLFDNISGLSFLNFTIDLFFFLYEYLFL